MSTWIMPAAVALCFGTAAFATTPAQVPAPVEPSANEPTAQPRPLRVAPFTKSNLKDCVPTTAPVQRDATRCA